MAHVEIGCFIAEALLVVLGLALAGRLWQAEERLGTHDQVRRLLMRHYLLDP